MGEVSQLHVCFKIYLWFISHCLHKLLSTSEQVNRLHCILYSLYYDIPSNHRALVKSKAIACRISLFQNKLKKK